MAPQLDLERPACARISVCVGVCVKIISSLFFYYLMFNNRNLTAVQQVGLALC